MSYYDKRNATRATFLAPLDKAQYGPTIGEGNTRAEAEEDTLLEFSKKRSFWDTLDSLPRYGVRAALRSASLSIRDQGEATTMTYGELLTRSSEVAAAADAEAD